MPLSDCHLNIDLKPQKVILNYVSHALVCKYMRKLFLGLVILKELIKCKIWVFPEIASQSKSIDLKARLTRRTGVPV